jgi:hypothetical protein
MKITVTDEFRSICKQIQDHGHTLEQWAEHESDDMFQAGAFKGGFNPMESEFCFSYREDGKDEHWVQLPLEDVPRVLSGEITELEGEPIVDL